MSLLVTMHAATEGPCVLGTALRDRGHRLRFVRLFAGEPLPASLEEIDGIVSMGGPMNVDEAGQHPWITSELELLRRAHEARVPIVGVCLGAQLLAAALGGEVKAMPRREVGWHPVRLAFAGTTDALHAGVPWTTTQFHFHGQEVGKPPAGAAVLSSSALCRVQAFRAGMTSYGFQYHFEWDRRDLDLVAGDPFAAGAGVTKEQILAQAAEHYAAYRRLGDRVCANIAELLFAARGG